MGAQSSGSLNNQGFTESIHHGILPSPDHITHSGSFSQNFFSVGPKTNLLMDIYYGLAISNTDLYDIPNRNFFLSLFLKSSKDGQKRTEPINLAVVLDVSGSMSCPLQMNHGGQSRLSLAKKAIGMLLGKLRQGDAFCLITFNQTAKTLISSQFINNMDKDTILNTVANMNQGGGTTIKEGYNQGVRNLKQFKEKNTLIGYQSRIVLLTDVNDNSIANERALIDDISSQQINTTIIGISSDFKSSVCESLINIKGFNYFCAVKDQDLQTYVSDRFDYNFFPCIQDAVIELQSSDITDIQVFGSCDHNVKYDRKGDTFTVTKIKSGFPSALNMNKVKEIETQGGLILVKFEPREKDKLLKMDITIKLRYSDLNRKKYQKLYKIDHKLTSEEYFSDEAIRKGVQLYYYTQTMRNLLTDMSSQSKRLDDNSKEFYLDKLKKLGDHAPKNKEDQLQNVRKIVASR